ncbi:hypothetical protein QBC35DRAFT_86945 [Podospora australis]|uniref:BSD domain-containing protein n=1 Tax=Podospora australis TaxID=1536484 RepID=A0AAN6WY00_9PEZI|nr:hypothetical protein QBC35DRAFT_86945 [Podospora australis]
MASIPRGKAVYKKKEGILTLTDDQKFLIWSPLPATGPPTVSLALERILNLQQTPPTSAKVILKVIEKPKPGAEDQPGTSFLFSFTSPADARAEADAIRDLLSAILAELRGNDPNVPKPVGDAQAAGVNGAGASAAMSFASTVNAKTPSIRWFDDDTLRADTSLQLSLLKKDEDLAETYSEALALKPESIPEASFNAQFWSTRVNLLRAHAIELNQKKGAYNVLATIKPRAEDGQFKLSLSSEQITIILNQHPLVRRIYNENVPKLSETDFWSRFFLSKLAKKLRGERISDVDNSDVVFDKYLEADNSLGFASKIHAAQHVPHIIDVEANEENQGGFRGGNQKDKEMRPRANVPIIRTLNSLSEKIMADVAPSDLGPAPTPDGIPDATRTFDELTLRDLRGDTEAARIILNVKEQSKFFSASSSGAGDPEAEALANQDPSDVLFEVQADLETFDADGSGGIDLRKSIGVDDASDEDAAHEDPTLHQTPHVGSNAARKQARDQILEGMRKKRAEGVVNGDDHESPMSIPPEIAQRCYLTNATTTEFLKQFWSAFMSSDPARNQEVAYHVDTLRKSGERIEALAMEAEKIRVQLADKRRKEIQDHYKKTGKKLRWVPPRGGRDSVLALFEGTLTALQVAQAVYAGGSKA